MKEIIIAIRNFIRNRFNLDEDKAEEKEIVDSISRNVPFKGTNLWTLIFAILIASIGLNVNSPAVIIGAMLISPLMGPIMGIGLGIGILDFELTKRSIKNLFIAALFSVITSSLYFLLTPLHEARSEILARTTPSLWDVLIAFFGGMAGIIAGTRKEKSNVLPGVAIATALMPPLCTAGYGIASGNLYYFIGAAYLFFINSVFICLATFIIVRALKFERAEFATQKQHKRVVRSIWMVVLLTLLPSIYLAVRIVQKAIFEQNAKNFVQSEFHFTQTQVVNKTYRFDEKKPSIDLLLIGEELSPATIDSLQRRMHLYHLDSSWLHIRQGLNAKMQIDLAQIKASILEDVFEASRDTTLSQPVYNKLDRPLPDVEMELRSLYPELKDYSLSQTIIKNVGQPSRSDTVTLFVASFSRYLTSMERNRMNSWLKQRTGTDSLKMILQTVLPEK